LRTPLGIALVCQAIARVCLALRGCADVAPAHVQGFIWNVNSFDQWGVELGKSLASKVRVSMNQCRTDNAPIRGYSYSTTKLMQRYLDGKTQLSYPEPRDYFPVNILDEQGIEHVANDESHGLWTE
jgi:Phosphoglucose isomerase